MADIKIVNRSTKEAWMKNWEDISINTVLEIFSYERVKRILKIITSHLPRSGRLLEAGCGLGPWVIELTRQGYDITGIDYDATSISKINSYDQRLKVLVADVTQIPLKSGSIDGYLSFGVIEHFAEGPDAALREANRVLRENGVMVLSVPFKNLFVRLKLPLETCKRNAVLRRLCKKPPKVYYYQKYFGVSEISDLITRQGFCIKEVLPVDHIFSLVSFSNVFRDKSTYDGENRLAIKTADLLKKYMPWLGADSTMIIAVKK